MGTIRREGEYNLSDLYKKYKLDGGTLQYNDYKQIAEVFFKELMKKIVYTGYEFSMPYHCGQVKIIQLERKFSIKDNGTIRGAVDWGESNKLKKEIEGRGDIPLKDDNEGVPWLCYFTTPTYFRWIWTAHINMKNCLNYTFDVTDGNSELLNKNITDASYSLFKLRKRDGTNKDYLSRILTATSAKQVQNK